VEEEEESSAALQWRWWWCGGAERSTQGIERAGAGVEFHDGGREGSGTVGRWRYRTLVGWVEVVGKTGTVVEWR